jgi:hypothetical protein
VKKPDTFTITTFWMDWLLLPIMLGAAWLTVSWALADLSRASHLEAAGATLPAWAVSVPLFVSAAGWVVVGLGMLIKEEYWEFQMIRSGLILWSLCCLIGASLILLSFFSGGSGFGVGSLLNLIGLVLMTFLLVLPALIDHSSLDKVNRSAHVWFVLLTICVGCLMAGMLLGFPYNFPWFPLGLGALFFFGLGLTEVGFSRTSFPWLLRLWKLHIGGRKFHDNFPESVRWRVEGSAKMLVGIGVAVMLVIVSLKGAV